MSKALTQEQKAHVDKWLAKLKDGTHEQGCGFLKILYDGKPYYCCLGVAAEAVCGKQFLQEDEHRPGRIVMGYKNRFDEAQTVCLGPEEQEQLGLNIEIEDEEVPKIMQLTGLGHGSIYGSRHELCVQMNDEAELSFGEIAIVFEKMGWNE